jgi:hypothetical protein
LNLKGSKKKDQWIITAVRKKNNICAKNNMVLTTKPAIGPHSHMNDVRACESPRVCTNIGKIQRSAMCIDFAAISACVFCTAKVTTLCN